MMKQVLNKCKWGVGVSLLLLLFLTACADADRSADSAAPGEQFVITVGGIREGASQTRTEAKPAATAFAETSGGVYINASFAETDDAATTRAGGTTSMAVGTTFRVVAYRYPIATGEVAGQAEYTVTLRGVSSSAPLSLGAGAYAIVAYSYNNSTAIPALTADGSALTLTAGKDFLFSPATDVYLEEGAASTALNLVFDRQMARVCVKLDASAVGGAKITNPGTVQVVGLPSSGSFSLRSGKLTAVASSSATDCTFATTQGATLTGNELYVFPCSASLSLSLEGSVVEGFLPLITAVQLGGMTLTAGASYTLTANLCDVLSGANCYILSAAGTYKLDATIKGNGKVVNLPTTYTGTATRVPEDGVTTLPATDIASAAVLWETVNTTSAPTAGTIVSNVSVSNGIVTFTTGTTEGNAVIAVKNSAGTVLWSWHIWRTNTDPTLDINTATTTSYTSTSGTFDDTKENTHSGFRMMKLNLGALSSVAGDPLANGLCYQWGRKDPFKAGIYTTGGEMAITPTAAYSTATGGSIANAVKNPTTFYTGSDWTTRNDNLWGTALTKTVISKFYNSNFGEKSIYDPCPSGWRVPPAYVYANATSSNCPWVDTPTNKKGGDFKGIFESSTSVWFPASGYRYYSSGTLSYVGTDGYGWLASPNAASTSYGASLYFNSSGVTPTNNSYRANGRPVRCISGT